MMPHERELGPGGLYFIPGKKGPQRQPEAPEEHADELEALLSKPKLLTFRGVPDVPFYHIGDLARALNRSVVTIRKWQANGNIPRPSFHQPTKAIGGKVRLYSLDQIKAARTIAAEEGLLNDLTKAVTHTNFAKRVLAAWREL